MIIQSTAFDADTCAIIVSVSKQSPDISQGVHQDKGAGAGDQGMMFGYAFKRDARTDASADIDGAQTVEEAVRGPEGQDAAISAARRKDTSVGRVCRWKT